MYAKNCARCGKLFSHLSGPPLCQDCRHQDDEDFKKVKEYLYDHRGATMPEVSEAVGVSIAKIKRFLKEGRIEIMGEGNLILQCERCGASIKSGQYCEACAKELTDGFKIAANQTASKSNDDSNGYKKAERMRFLSKDKLK